MYNKYTDSDKQLVVNHYRNRLPITDIVSETKIPRSTVYAWIRKAAEQDGKMQKVSLKSYRFLENQVVRLKGTIEILKKVGCTATDPLAVKLPALEELQGQYSVHMLCEALVVSRGIYYNYIFRNKRTSTWYAKRREELRVEIQRIYDDSNQIFGAKKICAVMKENGIRISNEMVFELMQDMGLISIWLDAKDLYGKEQRRFKNHLNQQFKAKRKLDKGVQIAINIYFCF